TRRLVDAKDDGAGILATLQVLGAKLQERIERGQRQVDVPRGEGGEALVLIVVLLIVQVLDADLVGGQRRGEARLLSEGAVSRPGVTRDREAGGFHGRRRRRRSGDQGLLGGAGSRRPVVVEVRVSPGAREGGQGGRNADGDGWAGSPSPLGRHH